MRSSSDYRIKQRETDRSQTLDTECNGSNRQNSLYIVGIGPGSLDYLSKRAYDVLKSVDTVVGYTTYIDLIRSLIQDKQIISTTMTKEVERVEAALYIALSGKSCAIVSSGDPGIYAMAGLCFEICQKKNIPILSPHSLLIPDDSPLMTHDASRMTTHASLVIEVVPGIPSLCAGASLLGSPIGHDFAVISLSDLLTPWETIEKRIEAAAKADFIIVFYNPKSIKRDWQLEKAQKIILKYRNANTPVGVVTAAMREEQRIQLVRLKDLHTAPVTMQTTVFIGNSSSVQYLDFIITPRGYSSKYKIES